MFGVRKACRELAEWCHEMQQENDRLKAENAKLRKLCARMFKDFVNCDCELRARSGRTFMVFVRYAPELRELGIEVGE